MKVSKVLLILMSLPLVFSMWTMDVKAGDAPLPKVYSGTVNSIKFNKNGTFLFRLNLTERNTATSGPICKKNSTFFVHETYPHINSAVLKRMRNDVREAFFNINKPTISISVSGCTEEKGYSIVSNIMLGVWTED